MLAIAQVIDIDGSDEGSCSARRVRNLQLPAVFGEPEREEIPDPAGLPRSRTADEDPGHRRGHGAYLGYARRSSSRLRRRNRGSTAEGQLAAIGGGLNR